MADGRLTLDIEQKQVLVFFDDPHYNWHHRVLVCPLKVEGNWVALSPDLECEAIDLMGTSGYTSSKAGSVSRPG